MERRMDKTVVKIMRMGSPEFEESNMFIVDGTPQECWDITRETNMRLMRISGGEVDYAGPLRRDIVKKFYRDGRGELIEINVGVA
ncbi:MAG: hypothetical protein LBC70_00115 [Chitinispirillales bacterium]|jgi:hypothetical protein|nr:hypothetical protein [Chitinispirillales bacterium]